MKGKNYNINILRALATIVVVFYHCWVIFGQYQFKCSQVTALISLGGEIGVTTFFALSGYGIYCSLLRMDTYGGINFVAFMKKRLLRILPMYWFSIVFTILFTDGAYYFTKEQFADVLTHVFLIHNLFPSYFGQINGVLWTMGVIFQFYLIAIPLYKLLKKWGVYFLIIGICFTIGCKICAYMYILPTYGNDYLNSFFLGRQLFTALDNFLIGMFVAHIFMNKKIKLNTFVTSLLIVIGMIMICAVCYEGRKYGIHTNNISGYLWHSMLAISIGVSMIGLAFHTPINKTVFSKFLIWISRYEYGIYIWHLLMLNNLYAKSGYLQTLMQSGRYVILYIWLMGLSIFVGVLFSKMSEKVNWEEVFHVFRRE